MPSTLDDFSFLGCGWSFPPAPAGATEVAMVSEEEDVRQAILLILQTAKGERVMRPDFGCGLRKLVFAPLNTTTKTLAQKEVKDALIEWEPRIDVHEVTVTNDFSAPNVLQIDIRYLVRSTNTFYNLVFPFYLQEQRP